MGMGQIAAFWSEFDANGMVVKKAVGPTRPEISRKGRREGDRKRLGL